MTIKKTITLANNSIIVIYEDLPIDWCDKDNFERAEYLQDEGWYMKDYSVCVATLEDDDV